MIFRNACSFLFRSSIVRDSSISILLALILFSPLVFNSRPELFFFADLHNLYFPQFVNGYYQAKASVWYGIDLLTSNGSSAYFLRPNIPAYYPPHIFIYKLFNLDGVTQFATIFVWNLCIHAAISMYAILRLSKKYLKLDFKFALFLGTAYVFSIVEVVGLTPFLYIAALFPALVYVAMEASDRKSWQACLFGSFVYLCAFLSGYLPLAIHAVALSVLLAIALRWAFEVSDRLINMRDILFSALPGLSAAVIVFPGYLAILEYNKLVSALPPGVWAAHELAYTLQDLASLVSSGFLPSTIGETPHIVVGLLPLFIIGLAFSAHVRLSLGDNLGRLAILALVVFGFHVLLAAGRATGLPDVFYYLVPGLGKMHLLGRYLIVSSFFVFLASTLLLKKLIDEKEVGANNHILTLIFVLFCSVYIYSRFNELTHVRVEVLVMELLFVGLFTLILYSGDKKWLILSATIAIALIKLGSFNIHYNNIDPAHPPGYAKALIFSSERQQSFLNYARQHAPSKEVIKYADLTSTIDKLDGVLLNFPWMVGDGIPVSNYMGYELHLSLDRDYMKKFHWFGIVDFDWLKESSVDYLLVDSSARHKFAEKLGLYKDLSVPELDLGFGHALIKVRKAATVEGKTVDNGVFSVSSVDPSLEVSRLEGNLSNYIAFNVRSGSPISIRYLMFPNKLMRFFVNGQSVSMEGVQGLASFELSPGEHRIEYRYENTLHVVFVQMLRVYLLLVFCMSIWQVGGATYRSFKSVRARGDVGA